MAKIAFFTEALPSPDDEIASFSYDLIMALADQQHDILVISSHRSEDQTPPSHPRVQVVRPFRHWSWLELPKVLPLLLSFQPEVFHFIQPHREALHGWTNAMNALPAFSPLINRSVVVTSLFDVHPKILLQHRRLLLASDAITAANPSQLEQVENFLREQMPQHFFSTVLPVLSQREELSTQQPPTLHETLAEFIEADGRLVVVPGDVDQHLNQARLFTSLVKTLQEFPDTRVLFAGDWGRTSRRERQKWMTFFDERNLGGRVLVSGPLSLPKLRVSLARARVVFVASLPTASLYTTRFLREALRAGTLLVMSHEQAALDPLPWRHRETAFISTIGDQDWTPLLMQALSETALASAMRLRLSDFADAEALDHPSNIMSRVYADLLHTTSRNSDL